MTPALFYRDVVLPYEGDECLIWPFAAADGRYPVMGRPNKSVHRLVCEVVNGPPPTGRNAAHSCGQSLCVNRKHLRWATQRENIADKVMHGTMVQGSRHYRAKLTEKDVRDIRALKGILPGTVIGDRYGITKSSVSGILTRKSWKHI